MKKVLVTGGAGFIGSHLVKKLIERKDFVVALDNFDPYYDPEIKVRNIRQVLQKKNFILVKGDVRNRSLVNKIIKKYSPDHVVHLAAKVGVRNSISQPIDYMEVNISGTLSMLEVVKNKKIRNFIFASSSSVYGANKKLPFSESDRVDDQISPYAVSKRSAELLCHQYSIMYKIPLNVLRFFTVYGPCQRPDQAISTFIKNIADNTVVEIYGDGNSARDFIYIDDVIKGIMRSLETPFDFKIFNIGSSYPVTIHVLISFIEKLLHQKASMKHLPPRDEDMKVTCADVRKAKKVLRWKPETDIIKGLTNTICAE